MRRASQRESQVVFTLPSLFGAMSTRWRVMSCLLIQRLYASEGSVSTRQLGEDQL